MARGRKRGGFQWWWLVSVIGALAALGLILVNAPKSSNVAVRTTPTTEVQLDPAQVADLPVPTTPTTPTTEKPTVYKVPAYTPLAVAPARHRSKKGATNGTTTATTPPGSVTAAPGTGVQAADATGSGSGTAGVLGPAPTFAPTAHLPVTE